MATLADWFHSASSQLGVIKVASTCEEMKSLAEATRDKDDERARDNLQDLWTRIRIDFAEAERQFKAFYRD